MGMIGAGTNARTAPGGTQMGSAMTPTANDSPQNHLGQGGYVQNEGTLTGAPHPLTPWIPSWRSELPRLPPPGTRAIARLRLTRAERSLSKRKLSNEELVDEQADVRTAMLHAR